MTSRDGDDDAADVNPYDNMFGKSIVRKLVGKKSYIEKLNFSDFRSKVQWGGKYEYPQFIFELINYIAQFNIKDYLEAKAIKDKDAQDRKQY